MIIKQNCNNKLMKEEEIDNKVKIIFENYL